MAMNEQTIIIFDTETTGLPQPDAVPLSRQPQVIEFGAVVVERGQCVLEVSELFDPQTKLPEVITKITGIVDADLAGKRTFAQFLPELTELFRSADVLIAHNAQFDKTMLQLELARLKCEDFPWPKRTVCTAQEFHVLMGYRPRLLDAYQYFTGNKLQQTHRALDDAQALFTCCAASGLLEVL